MVVLDTDHMSLLEWGGTQGSATLRTRLAMLEPAEVVTTAPAHTSEDRDNGLEDRGHCPLPEATLLSRNLADFGRVPGLQVEDWTA